MSRPKGLGSPHIRGDSQPRREPPRGWGTTSWLSGCPRLHPLPGGDRGRRLGSPDRGPVRHPWLDRRGPSADVAGWRDYATAWWVQLLTGLVIPRHAARPVRADRGYGLVRVWAAVSPSHGPSVSAVTRATQRSTSSARAEPHQPEVRQLRVGPAASPMPRRWTEVLADGIREQRVTAAEGGPPRFRVAVPAPARVPASGDGCASTAAPGRPAEADRARRPCRRAPGPRSRACADNRRRSPTARSARAARPGRGARRPGVSVQPGPCTSASVSR